MNSLHVVVEQRVNVAVAVFGPSRSADYEIDSQMGAQGGRVLFPTVVSGLSPRHLFA